MLTHPELFRNDDVYWQEGRTVGGVAIGVIQRGGALVPMLPGNMGNGCTFPFAMLWDQMEGVTRDMVVADKPHPHVLAEALRVAKKLQFQGCRAIVGNCGYLINYQPEIAEQLDVPVYLSSLMQLPLIFLSIKKNKKIGVLCASGKALDGSPALEICGVQDPSRVIIYGVEDSSDIKGILGSGGHINNNILREHLVSLAQRMVREHPDLGSILLECTELPPYAWAIQRTTGLPVYDFTTLTKWVYSAVVRTPFYGFS